MVKKFGKRQVRGIALVHQQARLRAGMPLANQEREAYAKAVRATSGLSYQERTTPPVLRLHERFLVGGLLLCLIAVLASCVPAVLPW